MRRPLLALTLLLASCGVMPAPAPPEPVVAVAVIDVEGAARVASAVEPVAARECRHRAPAGTNCDFLIVVDPDPRAPPNAFQSIDDTGRPVLTLTAALLATVQNADELAFILAHESAHHILRHLDRQELYAAVGAEVFADLAARTGADAAGVAEAQKLGAVVGARSYSKEFELEADALGTVITHRAGFDPLTGAQFFARIPDPGDRFLGTHPPNAARYDVVRRTSARLGIAG